MLANFPTKKLFRTALYTSPLIAILAITPLSIVRSNPIWGFLDITSVFTIFIFVMWSLNIGLTYLCERYHASNVQRYLRYVLTYLICIVIAFFMRDIIRSFVPEPEHMHTFLHRNRDLGNLRPGPAHPLIHPFWGRIAGNFALGFCLNSVILIVQNLILLREKQAIMELENVQLKIKNIEATNQQLKQQIHPHFLFNSLNTLKSLIKKKPVIAEEYLLKLSDFLRSSISFGNYNIIGIGEELKFCHDYLEMQKIRFNDALTYTITIPERIVKDHYLPSFSLQLLAENAIKHNALTDENPLHIHVEYAAGRIIVSNNIQKKRSAEPSTGIGLANLAERYRIISGDELIISSTQELFSVNIKILKNESSYH
jgi:two-component system LytT family sensor kinase